MNATDILKDLYRHQEWADALVWTTVLASPVLTGDDAIRERLYHIHLVQRAFLGIWRGEPLDFKKVGTFHGGELATWGREYHADVQPFLRTVPDTRWDTAVRLPWAARIMERQGGAVTDPTFGETAIQVAMHSTYHRGQVNARIRELGVDPPLVDFIAWIWAGKPPASWPETDPRRTNHESRS